MIKVDRNSSTPVYRQVYEYFRKEIIDGSLIRGTRLPSIRKLQNDLGIAQESIKRAMADLEADGLITRIQGKGTFVASRKAAKKFWGLAIPFYAEFYNNVIVELRNVAEAVGAALDHACDYDNWKRQIEIVSDFAMRRAEAIIVVPTRDEMKTLRHFQKIARHRPLILFERTSIASPFPYVIQDYVQGVRLAMKALASSGAKRIAYVRDPLWIQSNPIYRTMEKTYSQFCEDIPGGYYRFLDSPDSLAKRDLEKPDFDGVICVNDQVACLIAGLLMESGIDIPGRVQVVGYNNSNISRFFTPKITTTCPDLPRMCRLVEEIIRHCHNGGPVERLQYVSIPRLLKRETTK